MRTVAAFCERRLPGKGLRTLLTDRKGSGAVEFATSLRDVLDRFNAQYGTSIGLRAGVDTGSVTSGLIARTSLAYDLWGDAVNLAYRVRSVSGDPGIYVSQRVHERTSELIDYTEAGTVEVRGKAETVWKVA